MEEKSGDPDESGPHSKMTPRSKLARYKVCSKIGAGGMGEVYLAQDTELERTVA